jgi:UDP-glucose 6-dehydrogenase
LDVLQDGYRGFEGKSLPKDLDSIIAFSEYKGVDMKLLKLVRKLNKKLLKRRY